MRTLIKWLLAYLKSKTGYSNWETATKARQKCESWPQRAHISLSREHLMCLSHMCKLATWATARNQLTSPVAGRSSTGGLLVNFCYLVHARGHTDHFTIYINVFHVFKRNLKLTFCTYKYCQSTDIARVNIRSGMFLGFRVGFLPLLPSLPSFFSSTAVWKP